MSLRGKFAFALQNPAGYIHVESIRQMALEVRLFREEQQALYPSVYAEAKVRKVLIVPFDEM